MNNKVTSEYLREKNNININGKAKDFSTQSFWHYSTVDRIDKILAGKELWLNPVYGMNDHHESTRYGEIAKKVFSICFCNSNTEKIPMWYLYSGIDGDGMRLGLTPGAMLKLISSIDKAWPIISGKKQEPILIGKGLDLDYGWVFYEKSDTVINYKGKWYEIDDKKKFQERNYFIKDYPWEYEKEFRIEIINKTDEPIERVAIQIPESIYKKLQIGTAPELRTEEELSKRRGIITFLTTSLVKSKLDVSMGLLDRNHKQIIRKLPEIIVNTNYKIEEDDLDKITESIAKRKGLGINKEEYK